MPFFPTFMGFINDKKPAAYVVHNGDDLAFMSYEGRDRKLDYSRFDTEGLEASEDDLRAYLFSDRGIYRPGEEGHIGVVVKQRDWAKNLADVPLQLEVTNPRGQVIDKPIIKLNATGFAEYRFATQETSPTGVYNIRLYITDRGQKRRSAGKHIGAGRGISARYTENSFRIQQTAAKGMDVTRRSQGHSHVAAPLWSSGCRSSHQGQPECDAGSALASRNSPDYQFFDPLKAGKRFDQPIGEAQTDNDGKAVFNLNLGQFGSSTYRLTFHAEGFAQDSGRSVHTASSALVSTLPYVIGMKTDGNLNYINKNEKRKMQFIAVNGDLTPVDVQSLKLEIAQVDYISSLIKNEARGLRVSFRAEGIRRCFRRICHFRQRRRLHARKRKTGQLCAHSVRRSRRGAAAHLLYYRR